MSHRIEISWSEILRQSEVTAAHYLSGAVKAIDEQFGKGYAIKNPSLVASFMDVAAKDYQSSAISVGAQQIAEAITYLDRLVQQPEECERRSPS
jgi:hypothetical protein